MFLQVDSYIALDSSCPTTGRFVLDQFDAESIVVYQAFTKNIAHFASNNGYLGGKFMLNRMSWIKPNFLWMMYRSGWATKPSQEHVLAIKIKRSGFELILRQAVHSKYIPALYKSRELWQKAVAQSNVRLQWDPDHAPMGNRVERRAIQLGLRGKILQQYAQDWIVSIEDITDFVHEQAQHVRESRLDKLLTPVESVYPIADPDLRERLQVSMG